MFPLDKIELEKWMIDDEKDTFYKDNFDPNDNDNNKGHRYYRMLLESYNGDRALALKHFLQAYLACVAFVDEQVGKVIDALNDSKFKDNTIIVFTSDHGWQMGEKNYLFKNSPWEESARIPMIIKTPISKSALTVDHPVSLIDLYPTLKDYCHLTGSNKYNESGGDLGGYSLKPFIDENDTKWKGPNGALTVVGNYGINVPTEKQNFSYRTKNWRYIRYGNGKEELYDHTTDSYEWNNLANEEVYGLVKINLINEMNNIIAGK
jgi:iduronate 2-sulfatase